MSDFSRAATLEDLKLLLRSLHEQGVPYLLVGGYALAALDKDIADRAVLERALAVMRHLPKGR